MLVKHTESPIVTQSNFHTHIHRKSKHADFSDDILRSALKLQFVVFFDGNFPALLRVEGRIDFGARAPVDELLIVVALVEIGPCDLLKLRVDVYFFLHWQCNKYSRRVNIKEYLQSWQGYGNLRVSMLKLPLSAQQSE